MPVSHLQRCRKTRKEKRSLQRCREQNNQDQARGAENSPRPLCHCFGWSDWNNYYMLPKTPSSSLLGQCVPSSQTHIPGKIPPCPHLVLHFDINETILVGDEAGGDSPEACLNKMLAKSAFVLMDNVVRECEGQQPEASRRALRNTKNIKPTKWWDGTPLQARCMSPTLPANPPPLYTEFSWPPNSCPYYRTSFKHKAKSFTKHDGAPYLSLYHQLDDKCSLLRNQCRNSGGFCEHSSTLHHILPAFFHTLNELKRQKKSFK